MSREIATTKQADREIQELIDRFAVEIYDECLELMIDQARTAQAAREEDEKRKAEDD